MKGRGGNSRLIVLHGKMLSVKAAAYIGSVGIKGCSNFKLFNTQFFKAILLCRWTEIGFFRHYQPSGVISGSFHLLCKWINRLLRISTQHDILGKFPVNLWNQLLLITPNPFRKVLPIYRPRFSKHFFNLRLIQSRNIPTDIEPLLKFVCGMIVAAFKHITHCPGYCSKLFWKHNFKALLCLNFQGFQLWNVVLCRSIFQFLHPAAH